MLDALQQFNNPAPGEGEVHDLTPGGRSIARGDTTRPTNPDNVVRRWTAPEMPARYAP
eukprot:gene8772-548_t